MKFTVLSFKPITASPLAPAPSVRDVDYITEHLSHDTTPTITDLMAGPIEVLADYRGVMLYCEGGVSVHRINPLTHGGNGMTSAPAINSDEEVIISHVNGKFEAVVHFE
jgi:hypothetical protein